jgi:voltage-gated potassium channel
MKFLIKVLTDKNQKSFWVVNEILALVIIISTVSVLLETSPNIVAKHGEILRVIDLTAAFIFTIEYIAYIVVSKKKWTYIFSFYGIIDLLSFLPTYIGFFNFGSLKALRVLRILRLLRLFRTLKLVKILRLRMAKEQKEMQILKLNLWVYLAGLFIATIIFSMILFEVEHRAVGTQILTIADAAWSVFAGLTSVGFGDIVPVTNAGRFFMSLVMLFGVGFLSFAIVVLGKYFQKLFFGGDVEDELEVVEKE